MRATVRTDRGERPAGRAELPAKERASGRMQRPAELVPIPEYLLGTSGRLRKALESCCILEKSRKQNVKSQQNSGKFCEIVVKNLKSAKK